MNENELALPKNLMNSSVLFHKHQGRRRARRSGKSARDACCSWRSSEKILCSELTASYWIDAAASSTCATNFKNRTSVHGLWKSSCWGITNNYCSKPSACAVKIPRRPFGAEVLIIFAKSVFRPRPSPSLAKASTHTMSKGILILAESSIPRKRKLLRHVWRRTLSYLFEA